MICFGTLAISSGFIALLEWASPKGRWLRARGTDAYGRGGMLSRVFHVLDRSSLDTCTVFSSNVMIFDGIFFSKVCLSQTR